MSPSGERRQGYRAVRREAVAAAIAVVALAAVGGMLLVTYLGHRGDEAEEGQLPPAPASASSLPASSLAPMPPAPEPMAFSEEGLAGEVLRAVERPARPGNVRVAVRQEGEGRWVCVLVQHAERYAEPEQGMAIDDFPGLRDAGFRLPPPQVSRGTASVFRSLAKRAMAYDRSRGDRILILLCPRDEWDTLDLHWPPPAQETDTR